MRKELVLFCGGPAIYAGAVPKPLQILENGKTLLETYLGSTFCNEFDSISVCCEVEFVERYTEILDKLTNQNFKITVTSENSTTLDKLAASLHSTEQDERLLVCTYPDIFYFGNDHLNLSKTQSKDRVTLSIRAVQSRLPRIIIDPYLGHAKSISSHQSPYPANPDYMFAGHLICNSQSLFSLMQEFSSSTGSSARSLELDFFNWIISKGIVDTEVLSGRWIQCDSERDLNYLMRSIG